MVIYGTIVKIGGYNGTTVKIGGYNGTMAIMEL